MSESPKSRVVPFEFWTFAGIGGFFVLLGTIYWFTSYEPAGTTMLLLCAGLGALGMWVSRPNRPGDVEVGGGELHVRPHGGDLLLDQRQFRLARCCARAARPGRRVHGASLTDPLSRTYAEITPSPAGAVDQQLGVAGPQRRIERDGGSRRKGIRVGHGMVGFDPPSL